MDVLGFHLIFKSTNDAPVSLLISFLFSFLPASVTSGGLIRVVGFFLIEGASTQVRIWAATMCWLAEYDSNLAKNNAERLRQANSYPVVSLSS